MSATIKSPNFADAYPDQLQKEEEKLLKKRGKPDDRDAIGFALSGGGIRSATFCLGIFQGLARYKLIGNIDYLSTVSGGGYFGSFFGRLFTCDYVKNVKDVEEILLSTEIDKPEQLGESSSSEQQNKPPRGAVFRWLRENGRYLSPNGAGDVLLGSAVLMRNWVALHVVLLTFVLMFFLVAQIIRGAAEIALWKSGSLLSFHQALSGTLPGGERLLWWSPYAVLVLTLFVLWVVPVAWAYWLLIRDFGDNWVKQRIYQFAGLAVALGLATVGLCLLPEGYEVSRWAFRGLLAAGLLALIWAAIAEWLARREVKRKAPEGLDLTWESPEGRTWELFKDNFARHWISWQLKAALVIFGAILAFTLIDSLGQTIYALVIQPDDTALDAWAAGIFGALIGLAVAARRIAVFFGGSPEGKRPGISLSIIATVAAGVILAVVLITVNTFSHAIAWEFKNPLGAPKGLLNPEPSWANSSKAILMTGLPQGSLEESQADSLHLLQASGKMSLTQAERPQTRDNACRSCPPDAGSRAGISDLSTPLWAWFVAVVLSLLFGRSRPFLNWSTHHPLYSARLIRAYLGASNLDRLLSPQEGAVTNIIPKDDISLTDYWRGSAIQGKDPPFEKGAPLHLINVTINETYDGRSQIQQKDRQGVGMALGPAAISAGVKHHAVFPVDGQTGYMERIIETYPTEDNYRVFDYSGKQFSGERLSLGRWVSISGAAFSTGLGSKTHLGLSLLAGFGNIRLGYWWNSGIKRPSPGNERFAHKLGALLEKTFPVQTYLLYEFRAHFSGTAHRDWYLSDGGHFENMGGYELIRRRLRKIVIIDAEADPDYTFEGLANLVRKARLDFQAEIHFLDEDALDEHLDDDIRRYFGSIETLRRGRWTEEPITDPNDSKRSRKRVSIDPVDHTRLSRAHAALARVYYDGEAHPTSWLLYIKPTLLGDEPTDVLQYHAAHNRFPQEPTSDQFFDEAQWESYRMLGEYIANKIFQKRLARMPEKPLNKKFVSELFNFR